MAGTYSAGGIVSGMDWNSIIDNLVELQKSPLATLQSRQAAVKSQISSLGTLTSRLSAFRSAATALGETGPLVLGATSTPSSVGITLDDTVAAGRYGVRVESLAIPAKVRSTGFAAGETVTGGTLSLTVMGQTYEVTVGDGASLDSVAWSLNHSGAPISAVVLDDGTHRYLSVTPTETGYPPGGAPEDALSLVHTTTGTAGKPLDLATIQAAENGVVYVDGLRFERQSNEVSGAIPGVVLSLKERSSVPQDLVIARDLEATTARVKTFVDAYNSVIGFVQAQLAVTEASDRSVTLAGDSAVRSLQSSLQRLVSSVVSAEGTIRSLADLGVKTERNGSLTLDSTALGKAIAKDARGVSALFTEAETGIAALADDLVGRFIDSDGILTDRTKSLERRVSEMDDEALKLQDRIDKYREQLLQQFNAMETVVSGLKSMGNYLTALSKQSSGDE